MRWKFQWYSVRAFMVMFSLLMLPLPKKNSDDLVYIRIVNTGFWANWLVFLTIGFLVGTSIGGLANDDGETPRVTRRFSLRGLLLVMGWFCLLLVLVVCIAQHRNF